VTRYIVLIGQSCSWNRQRRDNILNLWSKQLKSLIIEFNDSNRKGGDVICVHCPINETLLSHNMEPACVKHYSIQPGYFPQSQTLVLVF
jgi:hypothetical protein